MNTLMKQINIGTLNRKPVVVLPANIWEKMQAKFNEMQEDLEMHASVSYKKSIIRARSSKKLYTSSEARKKLNL